MCRNKFWATATFNVVGFILTLVFLPDPLRISLAETDRRWRYITSGRTYHGEAVNPKSLSIFEWAVLRLHKVTPPTDLEIGTMQIAYAVMLHVCVMYVHKLQYPFSVDPEAI